MSERAAVAVGSHADLAAKLAAIDAGWPNRERGRPFVIGIAGGSGSGKTTIAQSVVAQIGLDRVAFIPHDAYYRHRPNISFEERTRVNYDHPDSLETELMVAQIEALLTGKAVERPVYDFAQHLRSTETVPVEPRSVLLIEGILILVERTPCRDLDGPAGVSLMPMQTCGCCAGWSVTWRIAAAASTRSLINTTRPCGPMHRQFVEPSKRFADIIIPRATTPGRWERSCR